MLLSLSFSLPGIFLFIYHCISLLFELNVLSCFVQYAGNLATVMLLSVISKVSSTWLHLACTVLQTQTVFIISVFLPGWDARYVRLATLRLNKWSIIHTKQSFWLFLYPSGIKPCRKFGLHLPRFWHHTSAMDINRILFVMLKPLKMIEFHMWPGWHVKYYPRDEQWSNVIK